MNSARIRSPRRLAIFGAIILALTLLLLFFARDIIREVFVLPLSYLAWVIGLFVDTTPQVFFWIGLLLLSAFVAYHSIASRRKVVEPIPLDLAETAPGMVLTGRVSFWQLRVALMHQSAGNYYRNTFQQVVGRLLLDLLAHRYRLAPGQVEERLREGTLEELPPQVRDYALNSLRRMEPRQGQFFREVWRSIRRALGGLLNGARSTSQAVAAADPGLEYVLEYMEKELEVSHDDSGV